MSQSQRMTYREACRQALRAALEAGPRVFLMGEGIGACGSCYAVTKGLLAAFGPERIRDTPLSEGAFTGMGIGAAVAGRRLAEDSFFELDAPLRRVCSREVPMP